MFITTALYSDIKSKILGVLYMQKALSKLQA